MKIDLFFILRISRVHLSSRLKQTIVAALGVTFGIGTYIILMSFMTGLNQILDDLILNRTPHVHLYNEASPSDYQPISIHDDFEEKVNFVSSIKPSSAPIKIKNALPMMDMLENDDQVVAVTPQFAAKVFYLGGSTQLNGMVRGIDIDKEVEFYNLDDYITAGDYHALKSGTNTIILGKGIAKKLSLELGDNITVSPGGGKQVSLKIIGLYESGMAEIDNSQSYANLATAQKIAGVTQDFITDLNIKLTDKDNAPAMAQYLAQQFDITATDIQTANAQFDTGTSIRNLISYAVSITLLIVAGFGIYNILNMFIYEKMDDIAILKATGFSGGDVQRIFIFQAMLIGLIGGILGLLLGFGVSYLISTVPFETDAIPNIKTYPVNFNPAFYVAGIVFAIISTFFAGYLPSRKAKNIDPVEIIRGK
ncbi:ABC transporter permease [Parvicella tangerina]|uniref:Lipoprotein-releasing system transmembrane protein LolE n=1 Tax=Parvicella tangerina TaxID=2829795 RepID=A0A916NBY4_9FLAO|nr:FtsX-like permease family protein [Parvicella tangerina]CAG5081916.1 Lipoprotein-releasing system transmembrane protein LolE [Parvicella tangerina]